MAIEFARAILLGKRIIILTQDEGDIPTDVRGLYRYIKYSEYFDDVEHMRQELSAQLEAIREEPSAEKMLTPMINSTEPAPARVIALDTEFITVRTDDGRRGILANTDIAWGQIIKDMTRRLTIGQQVNGAFVTDRKGIRYTLLAGQTNPWHKLIADYPPGTRLTSEVQTVIAGVGAFVHVAHGVNGRISSSDLAAHPHLKRGHKVEVTVTKPDADRRHINLRLERALAKHPSAVSPRPSFPRSGPASGPKSA